jgi:hypothetical protein
MSNTNLSNKSHVAQLGHETGCFGPWQNGMVLHWGPILLGLASEFSRWPRQRTAADPISDFSYESAKKKLPFGSFLTILAETVSACFPYEKARNFTRYPRSYPRSGKPQTFRH